MKIVINFIKNTKLLYTLEKKYKCKTGLKYLMNRSSRGTAIKSHLTGEKKATVRWDVLFKDVFGLVLLHEIGHCVAPEGFSDEEVVAELAAWNFVLEEKEIITAYEIGEMYGAFSSYMAIVPKQEDRAFYMEKFTQLVNHYVFGADI